MMTFVYKAKNPATGEIVHSEIQAETDLAAGKLLIAQQLFPISIERKDQAGIAAKLPFLTHISTKDKVIFTRQLSTLINAGLPLIQSLRTVQAQVSNQTFQGIIANITNSVEGGKSLSASFADYPRVFNNVYVNLVAAGESSGTLDETLERLANQQEKDAAILSKIRGALIYPVIVLAVIVAVIIFLLTTVMPQIAQLYHDLHMPLPFMTAILVGVSNFITHYWYLTIIAVGILIYAGHTYTQTEQGQRFFDGFKLKVPIFGRIFKKIYMARYARILGTLLASGLPMLDALRIVREAVDNLLVAETIARSAEEVKGGKALSATLEGDEHFLPLVPQMIAIGERAGAIDDMLDKVATFYESEVDEEIRNISTTIEPVLMIVLGLTVGFIIAAILLPVYSLVGSGSISSTSISNVK